MKTSTGFFIIYNQLNRHKNYKNSTGLDLKSCNNFLTKVILNCKNFTAMTLLLSSKLIRNCLLKNLRQKFKKPRMQRTQSKETKTQKLLMKKKNVLLLDLWTHSRLTKWFVWQRRHHCSGVSIGTRHLECQMITCHQSYHKSPCMTWVKKTSAKWLKKSKKGIKKNKNSHQVLKSN